MATQDDPSAVSLEETAVWLWLRSFSCMVERCLTLHQTRGANRHYIKYVEC